MVSFQQDFYQYPAFARKKQICARKAFQHRSLASSGYAWWAR